MNTIDFTIAIPTYNGAERLPKLLERLRQQIYPENFTWEIIIVDNNSNDNTPEVVKTNQANWLKIFPLKYCFEKQQGLAFARQKAVEEAQGKFVAFLDDDTLPASDWVAEAYKFGQQHPSAGAYGGQIHGEFEVEPPANFDRIKSFLAIKEQGETAHLYNPQYLSLPAGAGLVIRRNAWLDNVPKRLVRTTRGGNDFEISLHLDRGGWEIWYNPTMHLYHQIPKWRLEKDYLLSLSKTVGLCICELRLINAKTWQKPAIMLRIMLGNLRRVALHLCKYRWQIKTDIVAACEFEFFLSGLLSPFYFLKKQLFAQP